MKIEEIAEKLNECAKCKTTRGCKYYHIGDSLRVCTGKLIKDMAAECEKIAEQEKEKEFTRAAVQEGVV